jgi:hypothetical protein
MMVGYNLPSILWFQQQLFSGGDIMQMKKVKKIHGTTVKGATCG